MTRTDENAEIDYCLDIIMITVECNADKQKKKQNLKCIPEDGKKASQF